MGIFKRANNIYITVRDTYTSIGGTSYEEAEEVIIEATNGDLELVSQKKVVMQGLGNNSNEDDQEPRESPKNEVKYIVLFERLPSYDGEFGFDWMRKEFLCKNSICVEGIEELKKIYTPLKTNVKNNTTQEPYGDYYVPWLIMFPNHKDKVGKDVKLNVSVPTEYISDEYYTNPEIEEFSFIPSNAALRVEPQKINIDKCVMGEEITIYCDAPLENDEFIEVKNSKGSIVGKLNVMRNAHYEKLTINIHAIKSYITDSSSYGKNVIDTKLVSGGLQAIEDYLNKNSLNQALIQVKIVNKANPYDWGFTSKSLDNANKGRNPKDNKENFLYQNFKGMKEIINGKEKFNTGKILDFFHLQFGLKEYNLVNGKGAKSILLYLASVESKDSGGAAYMAPLDNRQCIIFQPNLEHLSSYAHEIGHVLGLPHTFKEGDSYEQLISKKKNEITPYNQWLNNNSEYVKRNPNDENVSNVRRYINYIKKIIQAYEKIKLYDIYKFNKKTTENIMDYDLSNQKSFTIWQVRIMQEEVLNYYR